MRNPIQELQAEELEKEVLVSITKEAIKQAEEKR